MGASGGPNHVQAALNAALGDRLSDEGNPLAIRMALRSGVAISASSGDAGRGRAAPVTQDRAVRARTRGRPTTRGASTPDRRKAPTRSTLAAEFGYTCQFVRYNTGRHVSQNGRELATLLSELVNAWPVPVERLLLVGTRWAASSSASACHYGEELGAPWTPLVRNVVLLASRTSVPAGTLDHTAARLLAKRKRRDPLLACRHDTQCGDRRLRFGYLIDEDWEAATRIVQGGPPPRRGTPRRATYVTSVQP